MLWATIKPWPFEIGSSRVQESTQAGTGVPAAAKVGALAAAENKEMRANPRGVVTVASAIDGTP
jgi:hypothetical protein